MSIHPSVLSSLPVFCAVVRFGSFSAAAKELNITQSAVSHRIKQLENLLGLNLITRSTRFIEITESGMRLADVAQNAISDIERELKNIRRSSDEGPINISVFSAYASKWLMPNLTSYNNQYPKHPISVLSDERVVDLRRESIDGAIRFTETVDPSLDTTYLCGDLIVPVSSPALIDEDNIIDNPEALFKYPLMSVLWLQNASKAHSWENWFASQNITLPNVPDWQTFNRTDIALQAVMAGHGIALARAILLETDMHDVELLRQVGRAIKSSYSYYFVCLPENAEKPAIVAFKNWLKEEMTKTYDSMSKLLIS